MATNIAPFQSPHTNIWGQIAKYAPKFCTQFCNLDPDLTLFLQKLKGTVQEVPRIAVPVHRVFDR